VPRADNLTTLLLAVYELQPSVIGLYRNCFTLTYEFILMSKYYNIIQQKYILILFKIPT